jgi:excisionase family DNA binding protein
VTQNALDYLETPRLTSCSSGSLSLPKYRLEIAMTHFSSKPARSAQVRELTFEQLLDSDEAAALLKIHPKTLQKMARNGEITGVQVGRLWRFRASVINEWLEHKMAS